jgi:4-amino-4-deoxy-L-arabinose transferase-like glycosyltransferase
LYSRRSKSLLEAGGQPLYQSLPTLGASGVFGFFCFLTIAHLWLASYLPPAEDELYYWAWAQQLQSSYFDHPPMVAYFIRLSTSIFGDSLLAIRLPAVLSSLVVFITLYFLAPRTSLVIGALLCPLTFLGSVLMTPDLPLALFWLLYSVWFAWINRTLDSWNNDPVTRVYRNWPVSPLQWILGGVLLGFGGLSKYTMVLAVPCGLVVLLTRSRLRGWIWGYCLHCLTAAVLVCPILLYNWKHDFAPFAFQWTHSMSGSGFSLAQGWKFLSGQILLTGALPLFLFPWILLRRRDLCADPGSQSYFWFFVLPFAFFTYKGFRGPLEANWAIVAYLSFWPIADRLISWNSFRGVMRAMIVLSFAVPWAVVALALFHLFIPIERVPPEKDRLRVLWAQLDVAKSITSDFKALGVDLPLWAPSYQWTSYFRYLGVRSEQVPGVSRPSHFTQVAKKPCEQAEAFVVGDRPYPHSALACFKQHENLRTYPITVRGKEITAVWLSRYFN